MKNYQINYKISKVATGVLIVMFLFFLTSVIVKLMSLRVQPHFMDFVFLILFICFFVLSTLAIWSLIIKKNPVIAISSEHISLAAPYFFQMKKIHLHAIKEIKMSTWARSEIIIQDGLNLIKYPFLAIFLSSDDRESFLSNIFDLLPNITVK